MHKRKATKSRRAARRTPGGSRPRLTSELAGIDAAVEELIALRLSGTPSEKTRTCQLRKAVETLRSVRRGRMLQERPIGSPASSDPSGHAWPYLPPQGYHRLHFETADVRPEDLSRAVARWSEREALAAGTINTRLCLLSMLGLDCTGLWARMPRPLKWWLRPDQCERLLVYLRADPEPCANAALLADYVEWACFVGMRVEENLRLTWADVHIAFEAEEGGGLASRAEVTVPGTKTAGAQASIALALRPALLLKRRFDSRGRSRDARVFPATYRQLHDAWKHARAFLGAADDPLSTLRALRLTAARHLTTKGMPLDVVRQYLCHSNVNTTIGYLRLVGGYSTTEQRRWL